MVVDINLSSLLGYVRDQKLLIFIAWHFSIVTLFIKIQFKNKLGAKWIHCFGVVEIKIALEYSVHVNTWNAW